MSKNMTRKGLAFGAGLALVGSGLVASPAQAALTGFISLAPTSGPASALAITAGAGQDFSLTASPAATVGSSGVLKFLVTDPENKFNPVIGGLLDDGAAIEFPNDATASFTVDDDAETIAVSAAGVVTITTAHAFSVNDRIEFSADVVNDSGATLLLDDTVYTVASVTGNTAFTLVEAAEAVTLTLPVAAALTAESSDADPSVAEIKDAGGGMAASPFGPGDTIKFDVNVANANGVIADAGTVYTLNANSDDDNIDFTTEQDNKDRAAAQLSAQAVATLVSAAADGVNANIAIRLLGDANTEGQFVVSSGVSDGSAISLDLAVKDAVSRTVTVQAWVDTFADGVIGATEYVSDEVTVSFVAMADVTATTSLTPPSAGDATLSARVTTSPLINLAQDENTDLIEIVFTRQGSTTKGLTTAASQNAVTGVITGSITTAISVNNITEWVDANADGTGTETGNGEWSDANGILAVPTARDAAAIGAVSVTAGKVASVTTTAAHNLRTGDKITYAAADIAVMNETAATVTVTGATTFTYPLSETTAVTAASDADETAGGYTIVTNGAGVSLVERVFAGDYTAQAVLETAANTYKLIGTASAFGTQALAADDTVFSTVASASLQGVEVKNDADDTDTDAKVLAGTTSVVVTATIVDEDGDAVSSGRRVDYTIERGAFTTIKVNGLTAGSTLVTDANGQVTFTVTDTTGADGKKVTIKATPEGVAAAATWFTLEWDKAAFSLVDLNTTASEIGSAAGDQTEVRYVAAGTSYPVSLLVADQWFTPASDADYRVLVSGSGVTEGVVALSGGKATVTVSDAGVSASFNTVLTLQKKSTAGTWGKVVAKTINTKVNASNDLVLAADASTLYDGSTADLADAVAKKALLELDTRSGAGIKPAYVNAVTVTGKAISKTTGVSLPGSVVTVSGPSNVLFEHGTLNVAKRGSLTFLADATDGEFTVNLYSTTAQKDTVITVAANGVSKTVKVTFTGIGVGEGTSLTVTAPAAVKPASTFQVKAKLADTYGNGVDTAAGRVKVTYTGPGIIFGTLPTETDANGELSFSVLLGSNDSGNVVVKVEYDQNGDADYVDAKDLSATSTTAITASGAVASSDQKVNAGSFKGYVALYAKGYAGQRMSAKVGNDWVVVPVLASNFERVVEFTGAGYTVAVRIYIDRVLIDTITVTTK